MTEAVERPADDRPEGDVDKDWSASQFGEEDLVDDEWIKENTKEVE